MARASSIYLIQQMEDVGYLGPAWITLAAFTVKHEAQRYLRDHFTTFNVVNDDVQPVKNFVGLRVQILPDGDPRWKPTRAKVIELEHQEW